MIKVFSDIILYLDSHDIHTYHDKFSISEKLFNTCVASLELHPLTGERTLIFHMPFEISLSVYNPHIEAIISTAPQETEIDKLQTYCEEYLQRFSYYSNILQSHVSSKLDLINRQLDCITDKQIRYTYRCQAADELRAMINTIEQIDTI